MALELKIESLRSRGELTADERDRLLRLLRGQRPTSKRSALLTPLRLFLLGMIVGVAVAYLTWGVFS